VPVGRLTRLIITNHVSHVFFTTCTGLDQAEHGEKSYEMTHYISSSLLVPASGSPATTDTSDGLPNFTRKVSVQAI
jgi:hypothetical protein